MVPAEEKNNGRFLMLRFDDTSALVCAGAMTRPFIVFMCNVRVMRNEFHFYRCPVSVSILLESIKSLWIGFAINNRLYHWIDSRLPSI